MPFYYDVQRLEKNPIFVHEEIKLPKALFGSSIFNATVNGQPISGRTLAIDPFTSPNAVILHYLINKNDVIKIANEWQKEQGLNTTATGPSNSTTAESMQPVSLEGGGATNNQNVSGVMEFTLATRQPGAAPTAAGDGTTNGTTQGQAEVPSTPSANATSTDLLSDTGGIHANVMWSPAPIRMGAESTAKFNFTDAFSGGDLNADVLYDLFVLDSNGTQMFEKKGLTAKNSQDTQTIKFPAAGTYQLVLTITGLQTPADEKTETPPPIDRTRNGIARGTVVTSGPTTPTAAPAAGQSNNSLTEQQQQLQQQNQTAAPAAGQSNNSLTEQQQQLQQQNQTAAPAAGQDPLEQLGQAISNIFGGGN
jgi:hypothetical protein